MICIYQLNFTEGTYIGKTTNLKARISHHLTKGTGGYKLRDAWEKQGYLGYVILEECEEPVLEQREVYWINTLKPTLNILPGGETMAGLNHPHNKTSKEDVEEIVRLMVETDLKYSEIADVVDLPKSRVYDICKGRSHPWATIGLDLAKINYSRDNTKCTVFYDIDNNKHVLPYGRRQDFCILNNIPKSALNCLTDSSNNYGLSLKKHKVYCVQSPTEELILTEPKLRKLVRKESSPSYMLSRLLKGKEYKGWKILSEVPN